MRAEGERTDKRTFVPGLLVTRICLKHSDVSV